MSEPISRKLTAKRKESAKLKQSPYQQLWDRDFGLKRDRIEVDVFQNRNALMANVISKAARFPLHITEGYSKGGQGGITWATRIIDPFLSYRTDTE